MKKLVDKVAIVTGGGSGIGQAIAILFAKEGAKVVVADIDDLGGQITVEKIIRLGAEAIYVHSNSMIARDNEILVEKTLKHFGKLDIACNNAGIGGSSHPTGDYPIEDWDKVISVNLSGVFYGMKYQIKAMLENGKGNIINMSSILGTVGFAQAGAYTAAKHGVLGLTKTAALEYGTKHIRINAICPGFIKTPLLDKSLNEESLTYIASKHAMMRLGTSEEVAQLALWLASDDSSFVTGSEYLIDGGYTAQ
jgi:NAD(P)-dependent dehydrogenase (short-subunit alcohol dehydrogenase family)